ncbi:unnamed protein product [Schistosoma haematobium]|nr:unnamed protein product [Schistosoma haematobium]
MWKIKNILTHMCIHWQFSQSASQLKRRTRHIHASVQVVILHLHSKTNTKFIEAVNSMV